MNRFLCAISPIYAIAFWINRRVEYQTEKDKKQKILQVLLSELKGIIGFIEWWREVFKRNNSGAVGYKYAPQLIQMSDETWKAFSDGGELQWINDPKLLRMLATTYADVRFIKSISEQYMNYYQGMNFLTFLIMWSDNVSYVKSIENCVNVMEENVKKTISYIENDLKIKSTVNKFEEYK